MFTGWAVNLSPQGGPQTLPASFHPTDHAPEFLRISAFPPTFQESSRLMVFAFSYPRLEHSPQKPTWLSHSCYLWSLLKYLLSWGISDHTLILFLIDLITICHVDMPCTVDCPVSHPGSESFRKEASFNRFCCLLYPRYPERSLCIADT